jgi:Ca-activated chloride channel family protein
MAESDFALADFDEEDGQTAWPGATVVFSGAARPAGGELVLFDSKRDSDTLPGQTKLSRLELCFPDGTPKPSDLDDGLALWLFVDDMVTPRAKVRLVDLVQQGGSRPLNVSRGRGQTIRVVLFDPNGAWKPGEHRVEVKLGWE